MIFIFYGNLDIVDYFNLSMLSIIVVSSLYYSLMLIRRFRKKRNNVIMVISLASIFVFMASIFFLINYVSGTLMDYDFINFSEITKAPMEPERFLSLIFLGMIVIALLEFLYQVFKIPNKATRKIIYRMIISIFMFLIVFYFIIFSLIPINPDFYWSILFIQSALTFFFIFGSCIVIYFVILVKSIQLLRTIEKTDKGYVKIKFMTLWCFFGGLYFIFQIIVYAFQFYDLRLGFTLILADLSSYSVYRAYIKE